MKRLTHEYQVSAEAVTRAIIKAISQSMSARDYRGFLAHLEQEFPGESFLIVRFGDHQPALSARIIDPAADSAAKQSALAKLTDTFVSQFSGYLQDSTRLSSSASSAQIQAQTQAMVKTIDDQKAKAFAQLADDDRTAAAAMHSIADLITAATTAKLPARFGP